MHQDTIAQAQFAEQDPFALAVRQQAQAGGRQQVDQLRGGRRRALASATLQVATGEQEQREHAHGIEVQLADPGDRGPDPGAIGTADRQRDRDVHGQVPGPQVAQGAAKERRAAVEHDRRGEEQGDPAQDGVQLGAQVDIEFRPGGHGCHHGLEPQQAGQAQLAQGLAVFAGQLFAGTVGLVGVGGVADLAQLGEQGAQGQLAVDPAYLQAMVGQVQPCLGHGRQVAQVFFDQPATGRATDAFHQQGGFDEFAIVMDEGLLHIGAVVQRQFVRQLHGQHVRVGGGFAAVAVVMLQATGDDGFGHGLAAGAAEFAGFAEHGRGEAAAGGDGQGAVVAGDRGCHRRHGSL